jgi:hypothetical protein
MKVFKGILVAALCLVMTSCGMHEFKQGDPLLTLEIAKETSKAACHQAQAANAPKVTSEMATVMIAQQKSYENIIGAITGKSLDPCSGGTNLNDVLIAEVRSKNELAGKFIDGGFGTVKVLGGFYFGAKIVDSLATMKSGSSESYTFTGDNSFKSAFNKGDTKSFDVTGAEGMTTVSPVETVTTPTNTNSLNTSTSTIAP